MTDDARTVFYSWQSQTTPKLNRYFIQDALKEAAKRLNEPPAVEDLPEFPEELEPGAQVRIDQAAANTPGALNIAEAIMMKINKACAVVFDVSLMPTRDSRPAPNANVMVELGYALHSAGSDRVVLTMNVVHWTRDKLPFDLRFRSLVEYELAEGSPKAEVRTLVRMLETRRFLPAARPRGWSPPITPTDGGCYHITAGREKLLVSMTREGKEPTSLLRVLIFPPSHSREPVSEQRCHEILAHFQKVQEWMEVAIHSEPRAATARNFLAIPEGATLSSRPVTKAQLLN